MPTASPSATRPDRLALLLLAALPVALLLLDRPSQASPLFLDPYLYIGYFLNLPGHLAAFPDHYISTRLPVLLPGWLAHAVLPPVAASIALRLLLAWASLFGLYAALRPHGLRPAMLAAVLLAGSPFFRVAVGTDYTDGYAIAFLAGALGAFRAGAGPAPGATRWLLLAGAALAGLVFTNLFFGLFAALAGLYGLAVCRESGQPLAPAALRFGLGFGLTTGVLAGCSLALGGPALFFLPSATAGVTLAQTHQLFFHTGWGWLWRASWLALPVGACLGGTLALALRREPRLAPAVPLALLGLGLATLLALERCNLGVVRYWYYVTPLLPFVALALGELLAGPCAALSARGYGALLALALLTTVAVTLCPSQYAAWPADGVCRAFVPALVVAAAVFALGWPRPAWLTLAAFTLLLAGGQTLSRLGYRYEAPWPQVSPLVYDRIREHDPDRLDVLRATAKTVRELHAFDRQARIPFWYSYDEPLGLVYREVGCAHFLHVLNEGFPAVTPPSRAGRVSADPPRYVALLSAAPDACARGRAALAATGQATEVRLERSITSGRIRFRLTVLEFVEPTRSARR